MILKMIFTLFKTNNSQYNQLQRETKIYNSINNILKLNYNNNDFNNKIINIDDKSEIKNILIKKNNLNQIGLNYSKCFLNTNIIRDTNKNIYTLSSMEIKEIV